MVPDAAMVAPGVFDERVGPYTTSAKTNRAERGRELEPSATRIMCGAGALRTRERAESLSRAGGRRMDKWCRQGGARSCRWPCSPCAGAAAGGALGQSGEVRSKQQAKTEQQSQWHCSEQQLQGYPVFQRAACGVPAAAR